jgi:hypothetical protein
MFFDIAHKPFSDPANVGLSRKALLTTWRRKIKSSKGCAGILFKSSPQVAIDIPFSAAQDEQLHLSKWVQRLRAWGRVCS